MTIIRSVMKALFSRLTVAVLLGLLVLAPGNADAAEDAAGTVTRLKGSAVAMQDAVPRPLKVGSSTFWPMTAIWMEIR